MNPSNESNLHKKNKFKLGYFFNNKLNDSFFSNSFNSGFVLLLIFIFGSAAGDKFYKAEVPEWFLRQFEKSIFDSFPGMISISFWMIAVMELVCAIVLVIALVVSLVNVVTSAVTSSAATPSILKKSRTVYLRFLNLGLLISFITFILLSIGQRVTGKFNDSAILVFYAFIVFVFYKMQSRKDHEKV